MAAVGAYRQIRITWTNPATRSIAAVEIWANDTNDRSTAAIIATPSATNPGAVQTYVHNGLAPGTTRYYWTRARDRSGRLGAFYPVSPTGGWTATSTGIPPEDIDTLTWVVVTGTTQDMLPNHGYIVNNTALVTLTLPVTAGIGKETMVLGLGAGGWLIAQNAGQYIASGATTTTVGVGGSLAGTARYSALVLRCLVADTAWEVVNATYTDEQAQDAIGAMLDGSLVYVDSTPLLTRAALSGDVTAAQGSNSLTIPNDTVTYAKLQNVSATSRLLGLAGAAPGDPEELTLSQVLDFIGSAAQGDILYRGAATWTRLPAGTAGQRLISQGAAANPAWETRPAFTGDVTAGAGSWVNLIPNDTVTYAKLQNVTASSRLIARKTAGAGDAEEATLSEILDFVGSAAQGDILYRGASTWTRLPAGTNGQVLTQAAGPAPSWAASSSGIGRHTVYIPAGALVAAATNPAALAILETPTNKNTLSTMSYADGTKKYAGWQMTLPKAWDRGAVTYLVHWTSTAATTTAVVWGLQAVASSDNDSLDAAYGTAIEVTDAGLFAAYKNHTSAESAALTVAGSPATGDTLDCRLYRDPTSAGDTFAGIAYLLGIELFYTTNATTDA